MKKCLCKDKKYHANSILGVCSFFGSKTEYRELNPEGLPLFGAYLLAQNEGGELEQIWNGDIESKDEVVLGKLKILSKTIKSDLYLYKASTVHNATFNGRRFPYEFPALIIYQSGEIEKGSTL